MELFIVTKKINKILKFYKKVSFIASKQYRKDNVQI